MRRVLAALLIGLTSVLAAGCDNGGDSTTTPTTPTTPLITENFTGTVDPGGLSFNSFTIANSGQVNVVLTAAGPPATIYMGLALGTFASGACTLLSGASTLAQAGATAQLSGTANAGTYCVEVVDAGNQTAQISYAVTVTHY